MTQISYLLLGLLAGLVSGFFGVGGGVILVPALAIIFGLSQHQSQGTALAIMLPPVFFLAVWRYYNAGNVIVPIAVYAAVGLTIGALAGANVAQGVGDVNLKRAFGVIMMVAGIKMAFFK